MTTNLLDKPLVTQYYEQMFLIRIFEEYCDRLYKQGNIKGFCHLYIGQEAIAVGSINALTKNDYIITHYRDHGHALARGMDPNIIMSELMGKATGSSRGKGGSMHLFDTNLNFMGGHAIVGGHLPIATGLALGLKYRKENAAVVCFFGDGAVNEGEFHESLNLASIWNLPVIFFLENNYYGMGSHISLTHSIGENINQIANSYNIKSIQADGMDVLDVRQKTESALQEIRNGNGPILIEAKCYRFRGHSVQDPQFYRDKEEIEKWTNRDPIKTFKNFLIESGILFEDEIQKSERKIRGQVEAAVEFAQTSPLPHIESAYEHIYA